MFVGISRNNACNLTRMAEKGFPVLGQIVNHPEYGTGRVSLLGFTTVNVDFKNDEVKFTLDEFRHYLKNVDDLFEISSGDITLTRSNLNWINSALEANYFEAHKKITSKFGHLLTKDEINTLQAEWVLEYFGTINAEEPSLEQAKAIATVSPKTLVTARAGSGKTRTIVNRAIFLFSKCGIDPSEMVLLAFNRKAAAELRERLLEFAPEFEKCHIMTFHALAYALVHPEEDLMTGEKIIEVNKLVREILKDKKYKQVIKEVMIAFFRTDWHKVSAGGWHLLDDKEQFLNFRRGLSNESMRGEPIKSLGEKLIADFLFENGIPYKYEKYFKWGDRPYRPDFSIEFSSGKGVIIEYFGMKGEPTYDGEILEKIEFWKANSNWNLISLYPKDLSSNGPAGFVEVLTEELESLGIQLNPQTEDELWAKIENRGSYQFAQSIALSIAKIRKRNLLPEEFKLFVENYESHENSEQNYLDALCVVYEQYFNHLFENELEDFDGLVNRAISAIEKGQNQFSRKSTSGNLRKIKYLFIDEYQDFTEQFYRITQAIQSVNSEVNVFCVGDDWQAINTFAGSDLKYFREFEHYFGEYEHFKLLRNYRSLSGIVTLSNKVMYGLGGQSIPNRMSDTPVRLAEMRSRIVASSEELLNEGDRLTSSLGKLIVVLLDYLIGANPNATIAVLGHNRISVPYFIRDGESKRSLAFERLEENVSRLIGTSRSQHVAFSTVHGYKGLQADVVILLDPISKSFPSVHHTWRLQRIFGQDYDSLIEEEKRLFYVALTRARNELILLCWESAELSTFLIKPDLINDMKKLDWSNVDQTAISEVSMTVWSHSAATSVVSALLKSSGFRYYPEIQKWRRYIDMSSFDIQNVMSENWAFGLNDTNVYFHFPSPKASESWQISRGKWKRIA